MEDAMRKKLAILTVICLAFVFQYHVGLCNSGFSCSMGTTKKDIETGSTHRLPRFWRICQLILSNLPLSLDCYEDLENLARD
jgi:hypothetical protein